MPFNIPQRTKAWSTGSRCRGGNPWRAASVFAEIGCPFSCIATSMTAATARTALRGNNGMERVKRNLQRIGSTIRGILMSRPRSPHWDNADSPSRFRTACRHSGGTEAAVLARGRVEAFRFNDLGLLNRRDHHLRDTSSTPDFEAFVAQIYKNDLYFAPIIGIDCSWRIEDRDAVANCESRARSDLAFVSGR